ncbi:centrosomal protein of 95 kDa isoform X6 [Nannospalax galili]|uniref:centrosomal protein of 95 kDa isoform X6 n=1 Tax=Nannospalax galili TaxID=1026970 RepID=UPI0004ED690F|nr:centrosomal protein of 95 kDa isoform X6 [Nannospalax galili]
MTNQRREVVFTPLPLPPPPLGFLPPLPGPGSARRGPSRRLSSALLPRSPAATSLGGMVGSEAEWVTIANNLLFKCHIHLRMHELEDCDANVFIALYQSILGEKVPDLIAIPRSQEDEAHNVQAVIDSLALDYLQVSLSHITGENIVKGDKESIKNLLEIFDGLLEYLTEHISETSLNKGEGEQYFKDSHGEEPLEELESTKGSKSSRKRVSFGRSSSFDALGPSWDEDEDEDEDESVGEIIRLGDTAHTFSLRSNGAQNSMDVHFRKTSASPSTKPHEEVIHPPCSFLSKTGTFVEDTAETPSVTVVTSARKLGEPIRAAIPLHPPYHPSEPRAPCPVGKEYHRSSLYTSAVTSPGEHRALSLEPDNKAVLTSTLSKDDEPETCLSLPQSPRTRKLPKGKRNENRAVASSKDSPLPEKARKGLTAQELHEVSEKLSQRLSELDWMLKNALGDRIKAKTDHKDGNTGDEEVESGHEEILSQHSDSIMEYGLKKPRPELSMFRKPPYRSHSLSPSSANKHKQLQTERRRQCKAKGTDILHFRAKEKIYQEVIPNRTPKRSQPQKIYSRKTTAQSPKGGLLKSNKTAPIKVSEHSLLPLMLEYFPFLYVSDPTLTKMWKQQIAQVEQLKKEAYRENHSKKKFQDEIEESLKRHDLLTALGKKEYEQNRRLQDFKDRIRRQRLTQSKIKENRQQTVRAQKYYDDYRVQLRAKMMRMRTREEMIFKKLFEEGLQIQKQRLRDLRNYAKEKRSEEKRQHQNELDSMENYYKDQFSLLAEAISQEHQELKAREKSQAQTLHKVKRELRAKMEKEIQQLQYMITQSDDDAFFQELEAERFKARLQLASFQYSKNPLPRGQTS